MHLDGAEYCFVVPRFGRGIAGGAETLVGELARRLAARGTKVHILTTCAKDNRSWDNAFPAGRTEEDGISVFRFPVQERNLDIWIPLQIRLSEGLSLSVDEQLQWLEHSVNAEGLYTHLKKFAHQYRAVFFAPYLFGTTFWGSLIHTGNSFLIPCLHDEAYAYVDCIQSMFHQVRGCLFNAIPEQHLALDLYGDIKGGEVGMGFDFPEETEVLQLTPYFSDAFPYLIYVGRKETGKNVHLLIDYFVQAKNAGALPNDVRLVIVGGGSFSDLGRDAALQRPDVMDISHVSEEDKRRLIRHSLSLIQPSTNESFSIVIMEAWLLKVPVLVHARCSVTRHHCEESGGGLYFGSPEDFSGVCTALMDPSFRETLAKGGETYVKRKYDWNAVLGRFDAVMGQFSRADEPELDSVQ